MARDSAIRKMLLTVQIEGHLRYIVPTKATTFIPPKGIMRASELYFNNFSLLPILKVMSEILLYGDICFHKLSPAFFFNLHGFQNLLLDIGVKPILWLFYHYFGFTRGKHSVYLNIDHLHLRKNQQQRGVVADPDNLVNAILSYPPMKHNMSKYIFADASSFLGSLWRAQRAAHESPNLTLNDEEAKVVSRLERMYPVVVPLTYVVQDLFNRECRILLL